MKTILKLFLLYLFISCNNLSGQSENSFKITNGGNDKIFVQYSDSVWKPVHEGYFYKATGNFKTSGKSLTVLYSGSEYSIPSDGQIIKGYKIISEISGQMVASKPLGIVGKIMTLLKKENAGELRSENAGGFKGGNNNTMIFPADGEVMLSGTFDFIWENNGRNNEFILYTDTVNFVNLFKGEIKDTVINTSSLNDVILKKGEYYMWGFKKSDYLNVFTIASDELNKTLKGKLDEIESVKRTDKELYYYAKANFELQNKLYSETYKTFNIAILELPDSKIIRNSYASYLMRLNLYAQAEKILN